MIQWSANKTEIEIKVADSEREKFQSFFDKLDKRRQELGIQGYGVGVSSLEDVFL